MNPTTQNQIDCADRDEHDSTYYKLTEDAHFSRCPLIGKKFRRAVGSFMGNYISRQNRHCELRARSACHPGILEMKNKITEKIRHQ
jgi:hypothetical protein